jgi:hypothetical protein
MARLENAKSSYAIVAKLVITDYYLYIFEFSKTDSGTISQEMRLAI